MTGIDLGDGTTVRTVHLDDMQITLLCQAISSYAQGMILMGLAPPNARDQVNAIFKAFMVAQMGLEAAEEAYQRTIERHGWK